MTRPLLRWARRLGDSAPVTVLDVGSGRCDLLRHLRRELSRRGLAVRTLGGDLHPLAPELARARPGAPRVLRLHGSRLPLADRSVDFVVSTITLHHLDRDQVPGFFAEAHRVSRAGFIVVDLHRTVPARIGVGILSATVWRGNPLPRHDGPVSVRRAFRVRELRELLDVAGVDRATVTAWPPFHVTVHGGCLARQEHP